MTEGPMNARWRLVPVEPDDGMIEAGQEEITERQAIGAGVFGSDIWSAMLSAAPSPTDAEIDELIHAVLDSKYGKAVSVTSIAVRQVQHGAILAFLEKLNGK